MPIHGFGLSVASIPRKPGGSRQLIAERFFPETVFTERFEHAQTLLSVPLIDEQRRIARDLRDGRNREGYRGAPSPHRFEHGESRILRTSMGRSRVSAVVKRHSIQCCPRSPKCRILSRSNPEPGNSERAIGHRRQQPKRSPQDPQASSRRNQSFCNRLSNLRKAGTCVRQLAFSSSSPEWTRECGNHPRLRCRLPRRPSPSRRESTGTGLSSCSRICR